MIEPDDRKCRDFDYKLEAYLYDNTIKYDYIHNKLGMFLRSSVYHVIMTKLERENN